MLDQDAEKNQKVSNPVSNSLGKIIEKQRGRREGTESAPARKRVKAKVIKQISVFQDMLCSALARNIIKIFVDRRK